MTESADDSAAPGSAAPGDRLRAFTTDAEERWLAGTGPVPLTPARRLPARAPLMLPHPGIGRWVEVARTARIWVGPDQALMARDTAGAERILVPPGQAHHGWWLVDRGPVGATLPPLDCGWFVVSGADRPLIALRLADWLPGWDRGPAGPELVRAAGAEAVCRALGVPFESVADPAEAARRVGQVPDGARFLLDQGLDGYGTALILCFAGLLLAAIFLLVAREPTAALATLATALAVAAAADAGSWWRRCRRTRRLPRSLDAWWHAEPAGRTVPGRGLGCHSGPHGQELVIADGHGGECWLAGPGSGGAAGLVVASTEPGLPAWGLFLYDRGERILAVLPAADWLGGARAGADPGGASHPVDLTVSAVTAAAEPVTPTRVRALAGAPATDLWWLRLGFTSLSALVTAPVVVVALLSGLGTVAAGFGAWLAALLAARILASRRAVL